jgi:uridine monophosphate synthetase
MKDELIQDLFDIGSVKFGEFTLKSGMISPIYIDLRLVASYPEVLKKIAKLISDILKNLDTDLIAGIPYTGIPIATAVSLETRIPMIYPRKEVKDYGTKKKIEGVFTTGQKCAVIDDLITAGHSKFEAAQPLEDAGLIVKDFIVLVDREQGGTAVLEKAGYSLFSVIKISELLNVLQKAGKITQEEFKKATEFIAQNKVS